ncbi:hypothetical protein [Larkinella soli]|uniref:hypothetical protein n=1 Tax=Larkinella soli TaxID=1770527 RepID=UPI000FFB164B|nr:hypothetical protein [Larkinella soli]
MKGFQLFFGSVLLLIAGFSEAQTTGKASFANTVIASTGSTTIEFYDSTAVYNSPNYKKTYLVPKPVTFNHNGYKGLVEIRDGRTGEVVWKGNINRLKKTGINNAAGTLRDSLTIKQLRTDMFGAFSLLSLLLLRFKGPGGRRKLWGHSPGEEKG